MKILVTGANGQLGYDVCRRLATLGYAAGRDYCGIDIADLDITDESAVHGYVQAYRPDAVIHCAAYTAVDRAERQRDACMRVNAYGTKYLAEAAA